MSVSNRYFSCGVLLLVRLPGFLVTAVAVVVVALTFIFFMLSGIVALPLFRPSLCMVLPVVGHGSIFVLATFSACSATPCFCFVLLSLVPSA